MSTGPTCRAPRSPVDSPPAQYLAKQTGSRFLDPKRSTGRSARERERIPRPPLQRAPRSPHEHRRPFDWQPHHRPELPQVRARV